MTPETKARIDADMAAAAGLDLHKLLSFMDGYTSRFDLRSPPVRRLAKESGGTPTKRTHGRVTRSAPLTSIVVPA